MNNNVIQDKSASNPIRDTSQERKIVEIATNRILQSHHAHGELVANNILKTSQLIPTIPHNLSTTGSSQAMNLASSRGATIIQPSVQHTPRASASSSRIESSSSSGIQPVTGMQAAITSVPGQLNVRGGTGAMLIYPSPGSLNQQNSSSTTPITLLSSNPVSYALVRPGVTGSIGSIMGGQPGTRLIGIQVPPASSNSTSEHTLTPTQQLQITIPAPARAISTLPARLSGVVRASEIRSGVSPNLSNQPHIPRGPSAAATALSGPRIGAVALARHTLSVSSGVSVTSGINYTSPASKIIVPVRPSAVTNQKFRAVDSTLLAGSSSSNTSVAAVQSAIQAGKLIGGDPSLSISQSRPTMLQQAQQIRALTSQQLAIHQGSVGTVPIQQGGVGTVPIRALLSPVISNTSLINPQTTSHIIASPASIPATFINRPDNFAIPNAIRGQTPLHMGSSGASVLLPSGSLSLSNSMLLSANTSTPASTLLQCASVTSTVLGQSQMINSGPVKKYVMNVPQPSVKASNPPPQFTISRLAKEATQAAPLNLSQSSSAAVIRGTKPVRLPLLGQYPGQAVLSVVTSKVGPQIVSLAPLGLSSAMLTGSASSSAVNTIPVAKVTPQGHTVLPLTNELRPSLASNKQQQQRQTAAAVSQAIQLQPGMFISSSYGSLAAGALSQSLSQVDMSRLTAVDTRQHTDRFSVLHQLTLTDDNRMLASPQIMNLSNPSNYTVPAMVLPNPNLRPASVSSQTSMTNLATSSQGNLVPSIRHNPMLMTVDGTGRQQTLSLQNFSATALHTDGRFAGTALNLGSSVVNAAAVSAGVPGQPTVITVMQPPQIQHSHTSLENTNQLTMSPRPSILRKRHHDSATLGPRNLLSSLTTSVHGNPLSAIVSMPETRVAASPRDGSRENSQSSTDTASSAESTPRSQLPPGVGGGPPTNPHPGADKGHQPAEHLPSQQHMTTNGLGQTADYKAVPRKKPRKQSLHANEEISGGLLSDDEDDEDDNDDTLQRLSADDSAADDTLCEEVDEFVDEEGVRWIREKKRPNLTIVGAYQCSWKPRNNHFLSYADIKHKEERKPTINELANQKNIYQKISGWKLDHLAAQLQALVDLEADVLERVKTLQSEMSTKPVLRHSSADDEFKGVREVAQANIQRSQLFIDQMNEAKTSLLRLLERKARINDIVNRYQSKRNVKKKER